MDKPTWATVVGIMMILIGGCGTINNVKKINAPKAIDMASEIMNNVPPENTPDKNQDISENQDSTYQSTGREQDSVLQNRMEQDSMVTAMFEKYFGSMEKMMVFTDYYKKWIVRLGIIGTLIALLYFLAGILLTLGKPIALKLTYIALLTNLAFMIFQIIIMSMDKEGGMLSKMSVNLGSYFTIFLDLVLLVIVFAVDKSFFYRSKEIQ